jgi:hypothetical protein
MGNCCIAESPSSFLNLCNCQIPCSFCVRVHYLSSCSCMLLLRPSFSQGHAYKPISHAPCCILRQCITWQYPLPSIVTSCTSALIANTCSSLLLPLVPAHRLPIPTPLYCCILCQHFLTISLFTAVLESPTSVLLNYKLHPVVLLCTLS